MKSMRLALKRDAHDWPVLEQSVPSAAASLDPRDRVRALVLRHGWNATAFQTLESGYQYFFFEDTACVAYVDTGGAWVAAGAPIAEPRALAETVSAFIAAARAAGKRCCFFASEARLQASTGEVLRSLAVGEQPIWDPRVWPEVLSQRKSLREQLRRARAKGVRIRLLSPDELSAGATHQQVAHIATRWLGTRALAEMGFIVRLEPFTFPTERRCFVAELNGQVVAFADLIPVARRGGWFLEDLVRDPEAPNGTSELLVDAAMRWARADGCTFFTFGLAPLAGTLPGFLRVIRHATRALYDFEGLYAYKAKFMPQAWSPIYLSYPARQSLVASMRDALRAFAQGSLLAFGWRSLVRGPRIVLRGLSWLLIPWIILLLIAPARRTFGAEWVKWAWVYFDVCVALALFRVLRKPTRGLLTALCVALTADTVLTMFGAMFWNLRHARASYDYVLILLACAAPALAALVLWGARKRLHFN